MHDIKQKQKAEDNGCICELRYLVCFSRITLYRCTSFLNTGPKKSICTFVDGKYVIALLPTEFGKYLIYQLNLLQ